MNLLSSYDELLSLIPQRPPFVLVDKLVRHEEKVVTSGFFIPTDHVLTDDQGFLSEAGIIENFAQTIALYQGYDYFLRGKPSPVGYIGSIKNVEIFNRPQAGQELRTTVRILQEMMGVTMVEGEVLQDDRVIAKGEMRTVIVDELGK